MGWSQFWASLAQIGIILVALVLVFVVVGVAVHLFRND